MGTRISLGAKIEGTAQKVLLECENGHQWQVASVRCWDDVTAIIGNYPPDADMARAAICPVCHPLTLEMVEEEVGELRKLLLEHIKETKVRKRGMR